MKVLLLIQIEVRIQYDRYNGISVGAHTTGHQHRDAFHHAQSCASNTKNKNFLHFFLSLKGIKALVLPERQNPKEHNKYMPAAYKIFARAILNSITNDPSSLGYAIRTVINSVTKKVTTIVITPNLAQWLGRK